MIDNIKSFFKEITAAWNNPHSERMRQFKLFVIICYFLIALFVVIQFSGEILLFFYNVNPIAKFAFDIFTKIGQPIILGVACSIVATFLWELRNAATEKNLQKKLADRDLFKEFFHSNDVYDSSEFNTNYKTIVVVPSFAPTILTENLEDTKKVFLESNKNNLPYKKSTKVLGFPKKRSFTQADVISFANLIALYKDYDMVLPLLRTDIQGIYKFFQFNKDGDKQIVDEVYENIKDYVPQEGIMWTIDNIRKDIENCSNRNYKNYIVIGLFSNSFLMDFLNTQNDIESKYFNLYSKSNDKNNNDDLVRVIEILDKNGKIVESPREITITDEIIGDDYALIAKLKYRDKNILIVGGGHSQGTEFAMIKLTQMWATYYDKFKGESFAIIYQLTRTRRINEKYVKDSNTYIAYPPVIF